MVIPDEAGIGQAPQSVAKAASERIRSGLSPKMINSSAAVWAPTPKPSQRVGDVAVVRRARVLVVQRDFLGESHPPTGERPEGVLGGRAGRVDGARSESGAAREQAVIGEIVEGFSQDGRGLHDDLLERVHRRGARFHGGIPCDLELADHLDGAVRGLGDGRRLPPRAGTAPPPRRRWCRTCRRRGVYGGRPDSLPRHYARLGGGPCQASAVAPGAFDPERLNPPVCLGPRDQSLVATRVRDERVIAQTDPVWCEKAAEG